MADTPVETTGNPVVENKIVPAEGGDIAHTPVAGTDERDAKANQEKARGEVEARLRLQGILDSQQAPSNNKLRAAAVR